MEPTFQSRFMTIEELYQLPDDGRRYELRGGWLVSEPVPGARHGRVAAAVVESLARHVRPRRLGVVFTADAGYILARHPDTLRGPDVSFVSAERFARVGDVTTSFPGPPDLAVEVLSPSDRVSEIHAKVADYLAAGARMVWVVDPETEQITVHRPLLSPRTLKGEDRLEGEDVVPGFAVTVAELFEI